MPVWGAPGDVYFCAPNRRPVANQYSCSPPAAERTKLRVWRAELGSGASVTTTHDFGAPARSAITPHSNVVPSCDASRETFALKASQPVSSCDAAIGVWVHWLENMPLTSQLPDS